MIVDPRFIADKLTPWQAGGKGRAIAPKGATKDVVIKQTEEFNALLKFAARFLADLQDKGG